MLIGVLLSVFEYGLDMFNTDKSLTSFYIIQLMLFFLISYLGSVKYFGLLHIFSLLHLTTFFFAIGGLPFGDIVEMDISFRYSYTPLEMRFQEQVVQKAIVLYLTYICSTTFFYFSLHNKNDFEKAKETITYNESSFNRMYYSIGKFLMFLSFPLEMVYSVKMMIYGLMGRAAIFAAGGTDMPIYLRIANLFFMSGLYIFIASNPPKKKLTFFIILYIITLVPILISGERGDFIVPIVFYIWYISKFYSVKINIKKLGLVGALILVGSYIVQFTRAGDDIDDSGLMMIPNAFCSLATSFSLMCYYITYKAQVIAHPYPFLLDGLIGGLMGVQGQNYETLEHRASIGHHLVYTLNPDYYLAGQSTGTSLIAEGYEFGILGVIFACFILAAFVKFIDMKVWKSNYMKVFLLIAIEQILLSPRGTIFISIYDLIKYSLAIFLCSIVYRFFFYAKINKSPQK